MIRLFPSGRYPSPQVQELLTNLFEGKELSKGVNPDEAVAYGAAIQADILNGGTMDQPMIVMDVIALSQVREPDPRRFR